MPHRPSLHRKALKLQDTAANLHTCTGTSRDQALQVHNVWDICEHTTGGTALPLATQPHLLHLSRPIYCNGERTSADTFSAATARCCININISQYRVANLTIRFNSKVSNPPAQHCCMTEHAPRSDTLKQLASNCYCLTLTHKRSKSSDVNMASAIPRLLLMASSQSAQPANSHAECTQPLPLPRFLLLPHCCLP
jgi:hypothetical protein